MKNSRRRSIKGMSTNFLPHDFPHKYFCICKGYLYLTFTKCKKCKLIIQDKLMVPLTK